MVGAVDPTRQPHSAGLSPVGLMYTESAQQTDVPTLTELQMVGLELGGCDSSGRAGRVIVVQAGGRVGGGYAHR
jgi:hypothetical protein